MASIRDRILDALCTALVAAPPSGGVAMPAGLTLTQERSHPSDESQLPVLALYFEDEEPELLADVRFRAPLARKLLTVTVEYRALASSAGATPLAPRKAIDPLYVWVMQQIALDETLGGLAIEINEGPTKWISREGDDIVAAAAQKFTIFYRTARLNPSAAG
jgi:hypothetical protein